MTASPTAGVIRLCATPIGNLGDITLRVLEALRTADLIACEDTRHTLGLLTHYDIRKPLVSFHQHNWRTRGPELIERARSGASVAVVSDAGMPGISDPGAELVALARAADVPIEVLPGASAVLTALVLSGLPGERFAFEGFLPREKKTRGERLAALSGETRTMIFYESPLRIKHTLSELSGLFGGDRPCAVARELTKLHEQITQGSIAQVLAWAESGVRGECVLLVQGAPMQAAAPESSESDLLGALQSALDSGMTRKAAVALVAEQTGQPKNAVYKLALTLKP